jgi:hypothetical protein
MGGTVALIPAFIIFIRDFWLWKTAPMIILVIPKVPPAGQRDRASILASRKTEK